jgi:hypothetical protein
VKVNEDPAQLRGVFCLGIDKILVLCIIRSNVENKGQTDEKNIAS